MRTIRFAVLCLLLLTPAIGLADAVKMTQQSWDGFSGSASFVYDALEDVNEIYAVITPSGAADGDFVAALSATQPTDGEQVTLSVELANYVYDDNAGAMDLVAAEVSIFGTGGESDELLLTLDVTMDVPYVAIAKSALTGETLGTQMWTETPPAGQALEIAMAADEPGYEFTAWTGSAVDQDCLTGGATSASAWFNAYKYFITLGQSSQCYIYANYTVAPDRTLSVSSTTGGSVTTPGEGDLVYPEGSEVTIEATADEGYTFTGWSGTAVTGGLVTDPNAATTMVTVDADCTLVANFLPVYALTVSSSEGGSATTPGEGEFTYTSGSSVAIAATADADWMFAGWTGTAVTAGMVADPNAASTTVTVEDDYTLVASFKQIFAVDISSGEGGSVTDPGEGTFTYSAGSGVAIVATADAEYVFSGWTGTAVTAGKVADPNAASTTLAVDGDYTLEASFKPVYTLTVSSGEGGSATTPGEGAFDYTSGTSVAILATADAEYKFTGWSGTAVTAGKVADANAVSTTVTIDGDYTLVANFTRSYSLEISSVLGGSVTAPGEGTFTYTSGTSAAVVAVADTGYEFTGWTGTAVTAGAVADPNATSTTVTTDDDYTLVANFAPIVTLTISSGDGGSATTPGEGTFPYASGTDVEIAATPDEGYEFSGWSGTAVTAGKIADADAATTTATVDGDYTLVANFTRTYELELASTDGGSVTAPGEGIFTYTSGTSAAVTAVADAMYEFVGWTGTAVDAGAVADPNAAATTVAMDDDYTLTANFLPVYTLTVSSEEGGAVTVPGEGDFQYVSGTSVEVVATADANYEFTGWSGTAVTADPNAAATTVTVDADGTLVANFTRIYAVEISSGEGGSVTTPGEGTFNYASGASIDIVAEADPNYVFASWTGTAVTAGMVADANEAATTLTAEGDYTLVANFLPVYALEISSGEGGSVTTPGEGTFEYASGTSVEIVAEADTHYAFSGWSGTAVDEGKVADVNEASTTLTVEGDYTLEANFKRVYALSISSTDGGSVATPGEGDFSYESVTDVNVVAVADEGYQFTGWSGTAVSDANVVDPTAATTIVTVDGSYSLVANFSPLYSLAISSEEGGVVTVPGEGDFSYITGTEVTVTAVVDAGDWQFVGWTGSAVTAGKVANPLALTTTVMVDDNYTLVASFTDQVYPIKVSSTEGGSVVTPGEGVFTYRLGDAVTLEAKAKDGYHFVEWSGNYNTSKNPVTIVIEHDLDLTAVFEPDPPVLTVSAEDGGRVIVPGEGQFTYEYEEEISAIAIPNPGYVFAGWTGTQVDSGAVTNPNAGRMDFVIKVDGTLNAVFTPAVRSLYVDDDAAMDPAPQDASSSDPNEDGSMEHPFDSVQEAIDAADTGDAVLVLPGTYYENISFQGKSLMVSAADLCTPGAVSQTVLAGTDANSVVVFDNAESSAAILAGLTIVNGGGELGGGIYCYDADPMIVNCLVTGNRADVGAGVCCLESQATLINCTIADNYAAVEGGGLYCDDSVVVINSILYGNLPEQIVDASDALSLLYSNVDSDPLFAGPGSWVLLSDPEVQVDPSDPEATWVLGDYHLMSENGRWDGAEWQVDSVTSPCIDAGTPDVDPGCESDRINMGAFGGTVEASL